MAIIKEVEDEQAGGETGESNEIVSQNGEVVQDSDEPSFNDQVDQEREKYQPSRFESFMAIMKSLIIRALIIYFVTAFFRQPAQPQAGTPGVQTKLPASNVFENGTEMDLYVYISESEHFTNFGDPAALVWVKRDLVYGDWDASFKHSTEIQASQNVRNNGSLYIHVYVVKAGKSPDPSNTKGQYIKKYTSYATRMLNRFKKRRYTKTHNLLTGQTAATLEEIEKAETIHEEITSHWHPNLTLNIVTDFTGWIQGSVPPPLNEYIEFLPTGDFYKPVVFLNDYWNMLKDYQPLNKTTTSLELHLDFQPLSLFRWQLYAAQAVRNKWTSGMFGDEEDDDQDSLKEALLETSPYLLGLTIFVSILHSIFEFLAFKNDIQFWNNRKSLEGLSVRSVFFNVFQSLIVLLYVLDNETNTVVRISCFVGLGIEIWKINKVMDISIDRESRILGILPRIKFNDKVSYEASSTKQYDMLAFRYLSWLLYPLLFGYAAYSLLYQEHKGWYSWVLSMLYGFLLTFGFIMMTPQLFINYKLKSVAHLPWRMLSYKFLNTFIDDIFAFVIKMPTMYRLGCFRDDIVFCVYVYQRYIYKTDPTRVNEFGFSAEMEAEAASKAQQGNNKASPQKSLLEKKED